MSTTQDFMWLAIGAGAIVVALAVAFVCWRMGKVLDRADRTLSKVESQLDALNVPVTDAVRHAGGVTAGIDSLIGRVDRAAGHAEKALEAVAKTAGAAQAAVTPKFAQMVGLVVGIRESARAFFGSGGGSNARPNGAPDAGRKTPT